MKTYTIILIAILFLVTSCASLQPWDDTDRLLYGVFLLEEGISVYQVDKANNDSRFKEDSPLFADKTILEVALIKGVVSLAVGGVATVLDDDSWITRKQFLVACDIWAGFWVIKDAKVLNR